MSRSLLAAVLACTMSSGLTAAAALDALDRQRLLEHLDMTAAWLADEVTGLTDPQQRFRPGPGQWTIAEILDHLVVVAPIYWQDLQASLKQPGGGRASSMTDADVLWYGIDRARREQAIPAERPAGRVRDLRAALDAYRAHHMRLRDYVRSTDDNLRGHIVQRQGCDAYQWALLISTHEQRHILQIREVKRDPAFPKN